LDFGRFISEGVGFWSFYFRRVCILNAFFPRV
jgi:hypothetical protein